MVIGGRAVWVGGGDKAGGWDAPGPAQAHVASGLQAELRVGSLVRVVCVVCMFCK